MDACRFKPSLKVVETVLLLAPNPVFDHFSIRHQCDAVRVFDGLTDRRAGHQLELFRPLAHGRNGVDVRLKIARALEGHLIGFDVGDDHVSSGENAAKPSQGPDHKLHHNLHRIAFRTCRI